MSVAEHGLYGLNSWRYTQNLKKNEIENWLDLNG